MKILLANHTLSLLAGTETWTYSLAVQLKEMGHHVVCYSPELGIISDKLLEKGIRSFNDVSPSGIAPFSYMLEEPVTHDYDVIFANHWFVVKELRSKFPKTPIVSTIHGIQHMLNDVDWSPEHPAVDAGVNQFVAVSPEVQKLLKDSYGIDSVVIYNGIDIKKYGSIEPPHEKPKQFLINTNYHNGDDPEIKVIREAAKLMGCRVAAVGMNFTQNFDLTQAIKESDVVFARGRSLLEGVAAGRLGIVHGLHGTGGPVTSSTIDEIRYCNFSGRNAKGLATAQELVDMVNKFYNPAVLQWSKAYTAIDHNIYMMAERYLAIARDVTGQTINETVNSGVASDARPFKRAA